MPRIKGRRALRARLDERGTLLGLLQMYPSRLTIEAASEAGYDFIMFDGESGLFSEAHLRDALETAAPMDTLALFRLAGHDRALLTLAAGLGADVIVAPQVSTAAEAHTLASWMQSHPDTGFLVIAETVEGVANAQEILAVEGVDGVLVGPNDLAVDMGRPGDFAHPDYAQALARIEQAATASGKFVGAIPHGDYSLETLIARGHRLCLAGSDRAVFRAALAGLVAGVRK